MMITVMTAPEYFLHAEFESDPKRGRAMKRIRFTEERIIAVLREHEAGSKTDDLARKHGISKATLYNWKASTVAWTCRMPSAYGRWRTRTAK
jgi:hypothetical protein